MEYADPSTGANPARTWQRMLPSAGPAEDAADRVCQRLQTAGFQAFRVGGCVRDRLLERPVADADVATDATPATVRGLFPRTYAVGAAFGVVVVHGEPGADTEVATFREESGYADGRHPDQVRFGTAAGDARRRDFTINALYYDPIRRQITDFTGGLADLARGVVRAIGDPRARFAEDHLRLLRAVRFAAELGFDLDPATRAAIPPLASTLVSLSAERVYSETTRMLTGRAPHAALRLLRDLGLLDAWLPEVAALYGVEQPPEFHPEGDVWTHTLGMLERLRGAGEVLAWATLLHDVGKPPTRVHSANPPGPRFPAHAAVGGELATAILRRLRASRRVCDEVADLVGQHMTFADVQRMRPATRRRLLARPTFADDLELHRLDCLASHGKLDNYCFLLDRIRELAAEPVLPPPLVSGQDVLALGLLAGPRVGCILRQVREAQLNGDLADRPAALALVRDLAAAPAPADPASDARRSPDPPTSASAGPDGSGGAA